MTLENQVCGLELAKRLQELGVKQESLFYWIEYNDGVTELMYRPNAEPFIKYVGYSAFTVAELGEMLPKNFRSGRTRGNGEDNGGYVCQVLDSGYNQQFAETESDARAKMLIYLLENSLISN